mmetsp:Transcript_31325/g.76420  ORF Transcript_31325/g.76420 Transcript_31325/m.76420 type:complete len:100 (-) Transcript_31325:50-349(-)
MPKRRNMATNTRMRMWKKRGMGTRMVMSKKFTSKTSQCTTMKTKIKIASRSLRVPVAFQLPIKTNPSSNNEPFTNSVQVIYVHEFGTCILNASRINDQQ